MKKNKTITILLIIILSLISITLTVFMIKMINGSIKIPNFRFSNKVSNTLVANEEYNQDFNEINIKTSASDIYIKESLNDKVRVVIYGDKDKASLNTNNNKLNISSEERTCIGFCFNISIAKIEVYLPKSYKDSIIINNNYGDIEIEEFTDATIKISEDSGNVKVKNASLLNIKNNYGDIKIGKVKNANLIDDSGDIEITSVDNVDIKNSYGDINITRVNNYLNINEDCGVINIKQITLKKNSYIKNNYGDIKISSTNQIYIDAKTDLGDIKINNNYKSSLTTLKIDNDCGDIEVKN